MPASSQIRSISIVLHHSWGALPVRFNGKQIQLPQLQKLTLGRYGLAYDDSFDWVLRQSSLQHLCLQECQIISYVLLSEGEALPQTIDIQNWEWSDEYGMFYYLGT